MILLAHHLEPQHVPVLLAIFAAGVFIGWQALSRWLAPGGATESDRRGG
jgi:hypothetical protein